MNYSDYAPYRTYALDEKNAALYEAAKKASTTKKPDEKDPTEAFLGQYAIQFSERQMKNAPAMPDGDNISTRFPGIDPEGKYSVIGMKYAQRMAQMDAIVSSKGAEVQTYYNCIKSAIAQSEDSKSVTQAMQAVDKQHRLLDRASKVCLDENASNEIRKGMSGLKTDPALQDFEKLMTGLEFAAGMRDGPLPKEVKTFYLETLGVPAPEMAYIEKARGQTPVPTSIDIAYQNFDNQRTQAAFNDPENWGRSKRALSDEAFPDFYDETEIMRRYVTASVKRALDPVFENKNPAFDLGTALTIDGEPLQAMMDNVKAEHEQSGRAYDPALYTPEMTIAAALKHGRHVEMFVPDEHGQYGKNPTQLTTSGFEPDPMNKISMNPWEKFWHKVGGFYQEKADKVATYNQILESREQFQQKAREANVAAPEKSPQALEHEQKMAKATLTDIKEGYEAARRIVSTDMALSNLRGYVGNQSELPPATDNLRTARTSGTTYTAALLIGQGHELSRVLDPKDLVEERKAAAQHTVALGWATQPDALNTPEAREKYKFLLPEGERTPEVLANPKEMQEKIIAQSARVRMGGADKMMYACGEDLKADKVNVKDFDALIPHYQKIHMVCTLMTDADQDFGISRKYLPPDERVNYDKVAERMMPIKIALNSGVIEHNAGVMELGKGPMGTSLGQNLGRVVGAQPLRDALADALKTKDGFRGCADVVDKASASILMGTDPRFTGFCSKTAQNTGGSHLLVAEAKQGTFDKIIKMQTTGTGKNLNLNFALNDVSRVNPKPEKKATEAPEKQSPQAPKPKGR